ncbi:transglycosylase domain-containing protein [Deinococcus sp.]|uniref:transglycosylase domain-containing protein n=1 Tax=Deinococcus sp. TaxID=47478 RepID=UPI003B5C1373
MNLSSRPGFAWRGLRLIFACIGALTLLTLLTGLAGAAFTGSLSRTWNLRQQIEPIRVRDQNGNDLGVIDHCDEVGREGTVSNPVRCRESLTVPLARVPEGFLLAYIAKEDVRYFQHPGIDLGRIPKSLVSRAGGSTITMQLLKNNVLAGHFDYDTNRTGLSRELAGLLRKAAEYVLAPLVTLRYSKVEVLELSVNSLPWLGIGQRRGLHDAARIMFGRQESELTLAQSAFLVGLLPRPGTYLVTEQTPPADATEKFRYMRQQQLLTLGILRQHALISEDDYLSAVAEPIEPSLWRVEYAGSGPGMIVARAARNPDYRSDPDPAWALQALIKRELSQSGISPQRAATVTLTIDAQAQQALSERVTRGRAGVGEGAAVIRVSDGGIVALASSTNGTLSGEGSQQWAVSARRSVASTVKPLLYSAAFGLGLNQLSTFPDQPTRYYGQAIGNNTNSFLNRQVSIREANTRSLNTVAVQVGLRHEAALKSVLQAVGYTPDAGNTSSPALGTWQASPLIVASAYASFANRGALCRPHLLAAVYDASGRRLPLPDASCTQLWDERVAYQTFDMLTGAVSGDASHLKFLRPSFFSNLVGTAVQFGAKSGTSDDVNDTWCAGVTPQYAMGVWLGDPGGVQAVPVDLYRSQAACRELGFLRSLPHTTSTLPMPAGLTRVDGAAVPAPGVTLQNPDLTPPSSTPPS